MKQNKDLIYVPQYEPNVKKMVTALRILLEYEPDNREKKEFIFNHKSIKLIKNKF